MEIVLISEELFKQNSPIKDDTLVNNFIPYIGLAQKMYIEKVLGKRLTEELQDQIKEAQENPDKVPYPITPENKALLQLIAPPLAFFTVYQGLPFHWAAVLNKGVTIRESENSKAVGVNDIAQLRRWLKDDAEQLLKYLIEYLCECSSSYPSWSAGNYCGGCGCEGNSNVNPFDFGIYIPK